MNTDRHGLPVFIHGCATGAWATNLEWRKIEALLATLGAETVEGAGSRVAFVLNGKRADFHCPHPGKEAKRYQVRAMREFLEMAGIKP
ncbi:type II toxin-antitoxin system HicA family toxin [Candidatus Amarolinea aalborgensis]|uniref:type II toxin-antitoxin system HicA family toxin n=1 Tax=Candidatus Amarolinea aalborgensis TaxID=2249329 RepID=UPI003BF9C938